MRMCCCDKCGKINFDFEIRTFDRTSLTNFSDFLSGVPEEVIRQNMILALLLKSSGRDQMSLCKDCINKILS
jgi:hypothetical protein